MIKFIIKGGMTMAQQITKAIIPAAGLGTRFLPATKATPKEMLPILDTPAIELIVEEAVNSGITDIIIITGKHKRAIEDHFDNQYELEKALLDKNKLDLYDKVRHSSDLANIFYVRQKEQKGLGHAILEAEKFIGNEPFAVLLGDDIVVNDKPATQQLIDMYHQTDSSVIGVQEVQHKDVSKYGIIQPKNDHANTREQLVQSFVEKPSLDEAPSNLAILGRYILKPQIFDYLRTQAPGAGDEIQLTDAIDSLAHSEDVYAYDFEGKRYDAGDKLGYIKANIDFALQDEVIGSDVKQYLKSLNLT